MSTLCLCHLLVDHTFVLYVWIFMSAIESTTGLAFYGEVEEVLAEHLDLLFVMFTVCTRCEHYILVLFLLSFFFSSPDFSGRILDVYHTSKHAARGWLEIQDPKIAKNLHLGTIAQLCRAISSHAKAGINNQKKNLLNSNTSSTCPHNMVNFGQLMAEI